MTITIDRSRDNLLTDFGRTTLEDRYMLPGESYQDMFARVSGAFADDDAHAQRLYDYMSKLWFMPSTPILSNGGAGRGLPISCFAAGTPIMTDYGCANIEDLKVGDMVLTHKGRFKPVMASRVQDASDLYEVVVHGRSTALTVTGNHLLLTNRGWVRVDEIRPAEDLIATSREVEVDESDHTIVIVNPPAAEGGRFERSPVNSADVTEDLAWALGFWFAEGSVSDVGTVKVTNGGPDLCQKWADIFSDSFGLVSKVRANKTWFDGEINSKTLCDYLTSEFGRGCKVKRLAPWILRLPLPKLRAFYEGVYAGDGFNTTKDRMIEMTNPPLVAGLSIMLSRLGDEHTLQLRKRVPNGSISAKIYHARQDRQRCVSFPFLDGLTYAKPRSIKKLNVTIPVYDIEVADDHSFSAAGVIAHNCFLNAVDDSIDDIKSVWMENVDLAKMGGGIGTYWGNVRGIGEAVGKAGQTSGVVPFIKVMDSLTLAISQGSLRRGSAAVYLDIHHPEIEEFIELRKPSGDMNRRSLNLHHGVNITDEFMHAVRDNLPFNLRSPKTNETTKTVNARDLWIKLLDIRMQTGEPYLLFTDTVAKAQPEHHKALGLKVTQSNLCVEIVLPTGIDHLGNKRTAVCCLSSVNAEKFLEWRAEPLFIEDVMRFLDNVLEAFIRDAPPSMANAVYAAMRERSVGLGLMGFHSFLQSQGIAFESVMAKSWNMRMFKHLKEGADKASSVLALLHGACPDWLDADDESKPVARPQRFSHKLAIAPTASISIICGGVSAGIEPIPANIYTHKTLSGSFEVRNQHLERLLIERGMNTEAVWSSILEREGSVQHLYFLTQDERDTFKTAFELDQRWVVELAADRQPMICQGQSINLFIPGDVDKWDLHMLHWKAWESGVKSLYYLRSKSVQRAAFAGSDGIEAVAFDAPATVDYDECLSCQ